MDDGGRKNGPGAGRMEPGRTEPGSTGPEKTWPRRTGGGLAVRLAIGLAAALLMALPPLPAPEGGTALAQSTVTRVKGKAFWREQNRRAWHPLEAGKRLPAGAVIKTEPRTFVRLIRPNGTIAVIQGGREQPADRSSNAKKPAAKKGFFAVLSAMFFQGKKSRMAAAESTLPGPEFQDMDGQLMPDTEWLRLMETPRFNSDEIEPVLMAASRFSDRPHQNRALALLEHLRRDFPADNAIGQLTRQARESFGQPAQFGVGINKGEGYAPVKSGAELSNRDQLRFHYRSATESIPYVFLWSVAGKTARAPVLLYPPDPKKGRAVGAGRNLTLPGPASQYNVAGQSGYEILWVWSCLSPVTEPRKLTEAAARVARDAGPPQGPGRELLQAAAPGFCPQSFSYVFKHR